MPQILSQRRRPAPKGMALADPDPTGNTTIADYIVVQVRAGAHPEHAAAAAGVMPGQFRAWMREGATTLNRYFSGEEWHNFSDNQQDSALFAQATAQAVGRWASNAAIALEQLARGGMELGETKVKVDARGRTETTTTSSRTLPDRAALTWKLERLLPGVYGSRATVDINVADLTDDDDMATMVQAQMLKVAERLGVIDIGNGDPE